MWRSFAYSLGYHRKGKEGKSVKGKCAGQGDWDSIHLAALAIHHGLVTFNLPPPLALSLALLWQIVIKNGGGGEVVAEVSKEATA